MLTTGDLSLLSSLLTSFSLSSADCLAVVVLATLTVEVTGDDDDDDEDDDDDGATLTLTTCWEAWDWTDVVGNTFGEVTDDLAC